MAGKGGEVTKDVGMLDIAEVEDLKFECDLGLNKDKNTEYRVLQKILHKFTHGPWSMVHDPRRSLLHASASSTCRQKKVLYMLVNMTVSYRGFSDSRNSALIYSIPSYPWIMPLSCFLAKSRSFVLRVPGDEIPLSVPLAAREKLSTYLSV
ncbi:hypothetical protein M430DRAFT_21577 [Amorphotheca resinae ATCC 22711]|uniref:Uncharacterized protein n=1 Tax=Amorphotheca resinae ATCC 22711 TaxID=857342 RepID=A0A2T3AV06_AMORE|nr:hypothetical protein M430DRAFT_21577 [Amorphotheca resinae ATCC 22711]PSS12498.1 hypothetical protein M430DRAFT_21577 [Amorphotheca resinae ATCC 22711]